MFLIENSKLFLTQYMLPYDNCKSSSNHRSEDKHPELCHSISSSECCWSDTSSRVERSITNRSHYHDSHSKSETDNDSSEITCSFFCGCTKNNKYKKCCKNDFSYKYCYLIISSTNSICCKDARIGCEL